MLRFTRWSVQMAVCVALAASGLQAQSTKTLGGGIAIPTGDLDGVVNPGFTIRGQSALPVTPLVETQLQGGWTRFSADDDVPLSDSIDLYHVSLGVRLGTAFFLGANGGYFFGDGDDQFVFFPEAGFRIGRIEVVGDLPLTGDTRWWAVRAAFAF